MGETEFSRIPLQWSLQIAQSEVSCTGKAKKGKKEDMIAASYPRNGESFILGREDSFLSSVIMGIGYLT